MEDEKSKLLAPNPSQTSASSAGRQPRRAAPRPPPVLAFIIRVLDHWTLNLVHNVALGFLTFDSLLATYRARSDPWTIAFVVSAYGALILFFCCIRAFETAPPARKGPLMIAVCALAMFLIGLFSFRVALVMPFGLAVAIWVVAGLTFVAGFYAIFLFGRSFNSGNAKGDGPRTTGRDQKSAGTPT